MQRYRIILPLILTLWANVARAENTQRCDTIEKLSRMANAITNGSAAKDINSTVSPIREIATEVIQQRGSRFIFTFDDLSELDPQGRLTDFVGLSEQILTFATNPDVARAADILWSAETTNIVAKAHNALGLFDCAEVAAITPEGGKLAKEPVTESPPPAPRQDQAPAPSGTSKTTFLTLTSTVGLVAIAVVTGIVKKGTLIGKLSGSSALLAAIFYWLNGRQRRRTRRHDVNYSVRWRNEGDTDDGKEGVILDINGYGVRLSMPASPPAGATGEILLLDTWHKARAQWSKGASCGLKLHRSLSFQKVRSIRKESRAAMSLAAALET